MKKALRESEQDEHTQCVYKQGGIDSCWLEEEPKQER